MANKKAQYDTELFYIYCVKSKLEFTYFGTKYRLCYAR